MNAKLSILFYVRKAQTNKEGLLPIYLRITIHGQRLKISTQRYIEAARWPSLQGKAKRTFEEARYLNSYPDILC